MENTQDDIRALSASDLLGHSCSLEFVIGGIAGGMSYRGSLEPFPASSAYRTSDSITQAEKRIQALAVSCPCQVYREWQSPSLECHSTPAHRLGCNDGHHSSDQSPLAHSHSLAPSENACMKMASQNTRNTIHHAEMGKLDSLDQVPLYDGPQRAESANPEQCSGMLDLPPKTSAPQSAEQQKPPLESLPRSSGSKSYSPSCNPSLLSLADSCRQQNARQRKTVSPVRPTDAHRAESQNENVRGRHSLDFVSGPNS